MKVVFVTGGKLIIYGTEILRASEAMACLMNVTKVRQSHYRPEQPQRVDRGIDLSFRDLEGGEWSASRPGRFTSGKTRYPLYRRLGGPQGRSGRVRKFSIPPGFDPRTVQPVDSRYNDWATGPKFNECNILKITSRATFFKLWSADHKWSSGSVFVVLLDWTLFHKDRKILILIYN
jgi:hypothetical protein